MPMSLGLNKINLCIIGKPNSGKSTLFNYLVSKDESPVGDEYGLTKKLYKKIFDYKDYSFTIFDTPGLRRRNKIDNKDEILRNKDALKLLSKVDVVILLIDSIENITKQDFRLADIVIKKKKVVFFLFNKIDLIKDKDKFMLKAKNHLKTQYGKYKLINIDFISAKKNIRIRQCLKKMIERNQLLKINIEKSKLNKFINFLKKQSKFPKVKNIELKPKYIVQVDCSYPFFKVFINSKNKAPLIFQKYFDNSFRDFFNLEGIPIKFEYICSKNPYSQ